MLKAGRGARGISPGSAHLRRVRRPSLPVPPPAWNHVRCAASAPIPDGHRRSRRVRPGVHVTDGRLTIDNSPAELAIRPLAAGRRNWLHLGGDGRLRATAVLLCITASVKRHGLDPWAYLRHVLTEVP